MPPILFQNRRFVVLDKPAGLSAHPGPRGGPSVEDWFPALSRHRDGPWLAHRLDADTSGCLVIALRKTALLEAQACFAAGQVSKTYWAVVAGTPSTEYGMLTTRLLKRSTQAGWRMVTGPEGAEARTRWRVMQRGDTWSWLELHPETGRTHQIRVHCAELGCPILGDPIYGSGKGRLQLLARAIRLPLDPPLQATAPVPPHMDRIDPATNPPTA